MNGIVKQTSAFPVNLYIMEWYKATRDLFC
jgi:hypothetical protein